MAPGLRRCMSAPRGPWPCLIFGYVPGARKRGSESDRERRRAARPGGDGSRDAGRLTGGCRGHGADGRRVASRHSGRVVVGSAGPMDRNRVAGPWPASGGRNRVAGGDGHRQLGGPSMARRGAGRWPSPGHEWGRMAGAGWGRMGGPWGGSWWPRWCRVGGRGGAVGDGPWPSGGCRARGYYILFRPAPARSHGCNPTARHRPDEAA